MRVSIINDERITDNKGGFLSHVDDICELNSLLEFAELGILMHMAPAIFHDNRKRQDCLKEIQFVCFDFDDGTISSQEVYNQLKFRYNHVILASKNHLKDKNDGKGVIERFHVFIQCDEPITSVSLYKFICKRIAQYNGWTSDTNCMEPARYFYKHSKVLFVRDTVQPLSVKTLEDVAKTQQEINEHNDSVRKSKFLKKNKVNLPPVESFKRTRYFTMLTHELNSDGTRYANSCQIIGAMLKCGLDQNEAIDLFDQYASWGKSFTRESISRRINSWK